MVGRDGSHARTAEQRSRQNPDQLLFHFKLLEGVNPLLAVSDEGQMGVLKGMKAQGKCLW